MSTTQPALCVPPLSSVSFSVWHMACTQAATKCLPTNGPLGGLGLLLPTKEFAPLNSGNPYEPAPRPATVTNTATTHQQLVFDREMMALGALTASVYDSIPLATRQSCPGYDPTYGTSFIPLPSMMDHVREKYGDSSVHAYEAARATLLRPFTGGDLDAYLATHVDAHLACVRAANPINDFDKVGALLAGVGGRSGAFAFTICQFEEDTPFHLRKFEDTPATVAVPEIQATPRIVATDEQDAVPAVAYAPGHPATLACDGLATRLRKAAQRNCCSNQEQRFPDEREVTRNQPPTFVCGLTHFVIWGLALLRAKPGTPPFLLVSVKQVSTKYKDKEWTLHLEPQYQTRYPAV